MKLFRLPSLALLAAVLLFSACKGKSTKDLIVKKWKFTDFSGKEFEGMPDSVKTKMMDATMEFKKDGKYENAGMGESTKTGTYKLSDDGKSLYTTDEGSSFTDSLNILEISETKLVVADKKGEVKITLGAK